MRDVPFTHQLQTTDEQFLDHLKLPRGVGRDVRGVAEHFRTRKSPAWSFYSHGSPWHQTDAVGSVMGKADNLLKNRFRNSWPPHQWMDLGDGSEHPNWASGLSQARTSIARG